MNRRLLCFLLVLLCFLPAVPAGGESGLEMTDLELPEPGTEPVFPPAEYSYTGKRVSEHFESDTLIYTIESLTLDSVPCMLTKIWVRDPERQIRKVNAPWGVKPGTAGTLKLARQIPETMLATNASGYITRQYPDIPESYPGSPEDYYYTTLGSLVITEGEILRNLEGVPFYGLALSGDGITLYRGADNDLVLATSPRQTWAFFENCAMQVSGEDLLPEEGTWPMAKERHARSVLARVNRNNYLLFHVPNREDSYGLSLYRINLFFLRNFETEWVYNLDGGHSASLVYKPQKKNAGLKLLLPNWQPVADILCITE